MITVGSTERSEDGVVTDCAMTIDRKHGTAKYELTMAFEGRGFNSFVWDMKCAPTPVPEFDKSRNKF